MELADALVTVGVALVVPLGAWLSLVARRDGTRDRLQRVAAGLVGGSAIVAVLTATQARGTPLAIGSAALALAASGLLALTALRRLAARGPTPLDELAIDAGALLLPVGSAFWLASRARLGLLGFGEPIVTYTAAHFHFAGFAAPIVVGAIGRLGFSRDAPLSRAYRLGAVAVIAGVPLTALGITGSRLLERSAAILLASGMLIAASVGVRVALGLTGRSLLWRVVLILSFVGLVVPMSLAVGFTLTGSAGIGAGLSALLPLPTMLRWHGAVNALVFAVPALAACCGLRARPRHRPFGFPVSRLRGGLRIGADFFARAGALGGARRPTGTLDRLADYAAADFDPTQVDPEIARFYVDTTAYAMTITPTWSPPFVAAGRLWRGLARRIGQLELPTEGEPGAGVDSQIVDLRDDVDGRTGVRGWIRTYRDSGRALFVAAYATTPSFDRVLMNIALPLPGGALIGALRVVHGEAPGSVRVTSEPALAGDRGDEGIYLATRWLLLRLPMTECLDLRATSTPGELVARHAIRVFGRALVTFEYRMQRATSPS